MSNRTDSLGSVPFGGDSSAPAISADGRFIAFESNAVNLVANDANGATDVFVRDRTLTPALIPGATERVSVGPRGRAVNA